MPFKFNPFTGNFDQTGSGGGGGGSAFFAGEVATYADLPLDGTAALNSRWLVRSNSGTWPFSSYKQAGVYVRTATGGTDRDADYDLTDTSFHDVMSDSAFVLFDDGDATKNLKFQLSGITTGTTRTLTAPNASGTIALTSDITSGVTTGSVDNAIIRADGTGGSTSQSSDLVIDDFTTTTQRNVAIRANRARFSITADAGTDIITATGSAGAFSANDPVVFPTLTGGSGLSTIVRYFVRDVSGDTFRVSLSAGGAAVDFATSYTGGTVELQTALVLSGSHVGGIIAGQRPDGTALGGNARGARGFVDLQQFRALATEVASGDFSVIAGGYANTASQSGAVVCGGDANRAGSSAVVCGGSSNVASGFQSGVLSGRSNTASADRSVAIGDGNTSSGTNSIAMGAGTTASAPQSLAICGQSRADRQGIFAHGSGTFSTAGDAQRIRAVLRCTTTTNAAVEMALDGGTTYLTIPSGKVMYGEIYVVGVRAGGADVAIYRAVYCAKNIGGTSTEVFSSVTTDAATGTSLEIATVDAGDYIRIRPTGVASQNWRWVAKVDMVEVAHG